MNKEININIQIMLNNANFSSKHLTVEKKKENAQQLFWIQRNMILHEAKTRKQGRGKIPGKGSNFAKLMFTCFSIMIIPATLF